MSQILLFIVFLWQKKFKKLYFQKLCCIDIFYVCSHSKSASRLRSGSPVDKKEQKFKDKSENNREKRSKSKERSPRSRSASIEDKRQSVSRSASPDENGQKSDVSFFKINVLHYF